MTAMDPINLVPSDMRNQVLTREVYSSFHAGISGPSTCTCMASAAFEAHS